MDIVVEVGSNNIDVTAAARAVTVEFPVSIAFDTDLWLSNLQQFSSNEAAISGGLAAGDWYRTSSAHVQIPGKVATRVI